MPGFRTDLSAQDYVLYLVSDIEFQSFHNKHILIVFVDIHEALDSVCVATLLVRLADLRLRGRTIQYLENCLSKPRFTVKLKSTFSPPKHCRKDCPRVGSSARYLLT